MFFKILFYLFFLVSFYLVYKLKRGFIYYIPIFNVLADISFNYFEAFSAPTILRACVLLFFLLQFLPAFYKGYTFSPLILYFTYSLLLIFFSSELLFSLKAVSQVILSMSMLIIGYKYFTNYFYFSKLTQNLIWIIVIGVVASSLGYLFGIGKILEYTTNKGYSGGPEAAGLLGSGGLYGPALAIAMLPIILKNKQKDIPNWVWLLFSFILYIFILLNVRRTAILIPLIGFATFLLFSKSQAKSVKYLVLGIIFLIITYPFYSELLEKRILARSETGRFEKGFILTEERYTENVKVIDEIITFQDPLKVLLGIGNNIFAEHIKEGKIVRRMYHSDSAKILYGEGLVGFIIYLIIYIQILRKIIRIPNKGYLSDVRAATLGLWFISLFVSFNGSISQVTFRSINFLLLGAFLGYAYSIIRQYGGFPALQNRTYFK